MTKRGVGRPMELSDDVAWFADHMEKAKRDEQIVTGRSDDTWTQTYLLDRAFDKLGALVMVCNESKSRSEVIRYAASVANVCRVIAKIERTNKEDDLREAGE